MAGDWYQERISYENAGKKKSLDRTERAEGSFVAGGIVRNNGERYFAQYFISVDGEAEAMYFKGARDFLKTSLAHNILCGHQDIAEFFEGKR